MVYIAAPFFNPEQLAWVEKTKELLAKLDMNFYSPKDVNLFENGKGFDPQLIFDDNVRTIDSCNLVIAITNDKDQGTHFEIGYAYAKGVPVIGMWISPDKDAKFNLMLSQSCTATFTSFEQLETYLKGEEIDTNWKGLIE